MALGYSTVEVSMESRFAGLSRSQMHTSPRLALEPYAIAAVGTNMVTMPFGFS